MKRKIKKSLKYAFEPPRSLSKESFLQSLPQPRCSSQDFIMSQIGYIPLWVWGISLAILLIALLSAHYVRKDTLGILSACIPFMASCAVSESEKSMVCRMAELEKASLFSLRSVVLTRLGIIGTSHLLLLCLISPLAGLGDLSSTMRSGVYLLLPYLLTTWLSLILSRKLHGRDTTYQCMGIAMAVSGLCVISQTRFYSIYQPEHFPCWLGLAAVLVALTALAYNKSIQRTEELSWNLF
ncbi:MAG: hypothetical protein NC543_08155 [bacterium]|nr:hypothetical protein [bacterium]MCM1373552.1 hypothetical protein [Muribaculum sp.]